VRALASHARGQWFKSTTAHHLSSLSSFKKFTKELLEKFIASRPDGCSKRTIEFYHYTLTNFVGYPLTPDGVNAYLKSLTCGNGKARFYQALKTLLLREWFSKHDGFEISSAGIATMLKRLSKETGIKCNPHSFRRGFAIHNLKTGLSTRIVQSLGGWQSISMVERYSRSLSFEDALEVYRSVNSSSP